MAGKKLFCKLDCSQAYLCLQMVDYQSIQMLAFNFSSKTFAYRRLAQGLSRSLSAFSSFMREYLNRAVKADQWIRNAGFKLYKSKCHFGVKQVDFLGRTFTPVGVALQVDKVKDFFSKLRFPKSKRRYRGL